MAGRHAAPTMWARFCRSPYGVGLLVADTVAVLFTVTNWDLVSQVL